MDAADGAPKGERDAKESTAQKAANQAGGEKGAKKSAEKSVAEKIAGQSAATAAQSSQADEKASAKKRKKSRKKSVTEANVFIQASYNNTVVTVTELSGDAVCWASAGSCGFKGTRKATPYAASIAVETALNKAKALGVERAHIYVKGIGAGRDQALRAVSASGVSIETLTDRTTVPHNGCRARKARRI